MSRDLPAHPLKKWREKRKYTAADVSALLRARGFEFKKRSIVAVEDGWRHPSFDVCEALQAITDNEVTVQALRHWPLREEKRAA